MHPVVVGISHRTAPIELRERLALARDESVLLGGDLLAAGVAAEVVVLSTCNRTEVYLAGADARTAEACVLERLAGRAGAAAAALPAAAYRASGDAAVVQLFRVAASLDSLVVGEAQVLAQVKEAFDAARAAGQHRRRLDQLFCQAIEAGQAGAQRDRDRRAAGVGELSRRRPRPPGARTRSTTASCWSWGRRDERALPRATCTTGRRRRDRRQPYAGRGRGAGRTLRRPRRASRRDRRAASSAADIVISSTAAPGTWSPRPRAAVMARRPARPLLLIDLAVPRDVDPDVAALAGCRLCDIDDLRAVVAAGRQSANARSRRPSASSPRRSRA